MPSTIDRISEHIARVIGDLGQVSGDVNAARQLLAMLGWGLPPGVGDIGLAALDVSQLASSLDALTELRSREDATDLELTLAIAAVIDALITAYEGIQLLAGSLQATPQYLSATRIADEFFPRLADLVMIHAIGSVVPGGLPVGRLLGLFEFTPMPADPAIFQVEYIRQVVRWDRLSTLFSNPADLMHDVYGWGTPAFDGNLLVTNIARVIEYLAAEVIVQPLPREIEEQITGHLVLEADAAPGTQLVISLDQGLGFDAFDIGVMVFNLRASAAVGTDGGIGISPFAIGTVDTSFALTDSLSLVPSSIADLQGGLALILRAGRDPALLTGLFVPPDDGDATPPAPVSFGLSLRNSAAAGGRLALFSAPGLSVDAAAITTGLGIMPGDSPTPSLTASIQDGRVRLAPGRPDGFIASILPADGITTTLNLTLSWSQRDGLRIQGGAGLRTTLALHQRAGPLQIDTLDLALTAQSDELDLDVTITGATLLGPVTAQVDSIGVTLALQFRRGNLGNADLGAHFKPPTGVGLVIDASVVVGGGYLRFDPQKEEYAGMLELQIAEKISVKAIGLLTTRMPDGGKGYSLVAIIFAQGFAPIQLGFGFALTGIGGLLAINRTFDEEALRAGLKNHTLDSVMFPKDPIRNAPQILSNLNKVFPPAKGHHLFGPMAQITWGAPPLITANLGLVLELGARLRLLILAQIAAILPRRENDLVRLQMDAIGVLDFDQGKAELDATLHDSRLLKKFVLTGDMAMRLKWEGSPNFALAVGGLHPAFNPPPAFPKLERIAINLSSGDNPRIRCEAYFALTSNTVQFGARAELYASALGFSIQGEIGFDVLIQLDPFFFLAEFHAQVQLKRNSTNLFKVRVEGALSGPRPLHIKAKATFEVLWWDVSIRIDKTLVEGEKPPLPEPIDVMPRLKEALGNPGAWVAQLPVGQRPMVTLRAKPGAANDVLLHPLGTLTVKQSVVPLNMDISRFGPAAPAGVRRFTISNVSLGGLGQTTQPVKDFFAPAQFFEMSDNEKLSRPSFEPMAAGVSIGSSEFVFTPVSSDLLEVEAIEFETWIVDKQMNVTRRSNPEDPKKLYKLSHDLLARQSRFGAAGVSDLRRTGKAKYHATVGKYQIAKEGWRIVSTDDLTEQAAPGIEAGKPASYSEAAQALQKLKQQDPAKAAGMKILRPSELSDE
jgi:hypothetical protein